METRDVVGSVRDFLQFLVAIERRGLEGRSARPLRRCMRGDEEPLRVLALPPARLALPLGRGEQMEWVWLLLDNTPAPLRV